MARRSPIARTLLATSALVPLGIALAQANPQGGQVVGGAATIQGQGTATVTVTQSTDRAIINWNTFNIGAGETTRFIQPGASSVALNRVTGGLGPSVINGMLQANGRVFVVNPDGIMIGQGAVIDTAGFLGTTHDIRNDDFMAGRYHFNIPGRPDASVVNLGTITATHGGFAALVAPGVRNSGTITATFGKVGLASANGFTLDFYGDQLITLAVGDSIASTVTDVATGQPLSALVKNDGAIRANGGQVQLSAVAARKIVDSVINNSGVIEARSIGRRDGKIVLGAATASSKPAGAPAQTVKVSGRLDVSGKGRRAKGGSVQVTGENIELAGAQIAATGARGGGTVLIGGDVGGGNGHWAAGSLVALEGHALPNATTVSVDAASVIDASALSSGDGGKVIVWADDRTTFAGSIAARGGAVVGNGGFVEVSGKQTLSFGGTVDTSAANGRFGTLLLDPVDYTIGSVDGANEISSTTLQAQLALNDVIITNNPGAGNGDIFVTSNVTWSSASSLTLSAFRHIQFSANGFLFSSGGGDINLRADNTGTGSGTVTFGGAGAQAAVFGGGDLNVFYNPAVFGTPDFQVGSITASGGFFTPYMLVNNAGDFLSINNFLSAGVGDINNNYALGKDIDLASPSSYTPIGDSVGGYYGRFSGQGYSIDGFTPATFAGTGPRGLFGRIQSVGWVRDLDLLSPQIIAGANNEVIGLLAGQNAGKIDNVFVDDGIVNGSTFAGLTIGGLVGVNGMLSGASTVQGTINNSSLNNVTITVIDGSATLPQAVGGLVGYNPGIVANSNTSGDVIVGAHAHAGGLVGVNQVFPGTTNLVQPYINLSYSEVDVSAGGVNVQIGGLVGWNAGSNSSLTTSGLVEDSRAFGTVNVTANLPATACGPGSTTNCQFANAGGLVGFNQGYVISSVTPVVSAPPGGSGTFAAGNVTVGSNAVAGGLIGFNDGVVTLTHAQGNVSGAAGTGITTTSDRQTVLGGLIGVNQGTVNESTAAGAIGTVNVANLLVGGLVGENSGSINDSHATGANVVIAGDNSFGGGLAGISQPIFFTCTICAFGVGWNNGALILDSSSTRPVTVGNASLAGGLAGASWAVLGSNSSGNVTGGSDSVLGGFVGAVSVAAILDDNQASGTVTSTGSNSWLGGFAGVNAGWIGLPTVAPLGNTASGAVNGGSNTVAGGFVGVNVGRLHNAMATGNVVTGANSLVGGLVGANFGAVSESDAANTAAGAGGSTIGGLIGGNGNLANVLPGQLPFSSFPQGTVDGLSTSTQVPAIGSTSLAAIPAIPTVLNACNDALCAILKNPLLISADPGASLPGDVFGTGLILNVLNSPEVAEKTETINALIQISGPPGAPPAGGPGGGPGGGAGQGPGGGPAPGTAPGVPHALPNLPLRAVPGLGGEIFSGVPPIGETRFVANEGVLRVLNNVTPEQVQQIAQQLGIQTVSSDNLGALGQVAYRFNFPPGRSISDVIRALEQNRIVAIAQPNYRFTLTQQPTYVVTGDGRGDPETQYSLNKLKLNDVHRVADGRDILVAVIDSEVDREHSELAGAIAEQFAASGQNEKAHSHGTAMVGAIVSRDKLVGVAPNARILAIRAFSESNNTAESTTYSILKAIDHAVAQGARVINMSFAGPRDPSLERTLKNAYDKGVVLVGAAGNAGPKSPPLFPGADPRVIGVTATDSGDRLFRGANQGFYVSVAAPGVDVFAPAPQGAYQMSTGTSIATAHISGVAALMLQRDPTLTPAEVRRILEETAVDLGPRGKDGQFGWGLVSPARALQAVDARLKSRTSQVQPAPATSGRR